MASGHVNRANRPNTWLHRPATRREILLANPEPSTHGTKRTCRHVPSMSAFAAKADIKQSTHPNPGGLPGRVTPIVPRIWDGSSGWSLALHLNRCVSAINALHGGRTDQPTL